MVDINLIGDNQDQFDEDNDENFQDSYNSDTSGFDQSSYMKGGAMDNQDYTKVIRRGGSKAGVYILFIIVVALLAGTAYILFKSPNKAVKQTQSGFQSLDALTEQEGVDDTAVTTITPQTEATSSPTEYIAPALREKIIQSKLGINTIGQIVNTIPTNVDFTMITYSDGKFLFELLAQGSNDISNVSSLLQQKLYSADIKLLSRDSRNIKGRQYYQALINGSVNTEETSESVQQPQFLSSQELHQRLTEICQENSLTIKQFDSGVEKDDGDLIVHPIKFRAFGLKGNAINLLQQISNENINVSFSKISLIANDVDLSNPYITLVMNIVLYRTL